jgi:hypothetical protein
LDKNSYWLTNVQGPKPSPPSASPPSPPSASPPSPPSASPEGSQLPADEIERTKRKLIREINRIDAWTNNLVDNGLFDKQAKAFEKKKIEPDKAFKDIQEHLRQARKCLYADNLEDADYYASLALRCYDKALYIPSRPWRFSNIYAGPIWVYLIGFLIAVLAFYWYQLDTNFLKLHVHIQEAALHATTWGTVGAILRGLWYLKDKVSDRRYRNSFRIYFLSVPFLGAIFGAIVYFILVSGLFILAPTQTPTILNQTSSGPNVTQTGSMTQANTTTASAATVSTLAIIPLATLAGFNWEWAIVIFKRIGDSFKGEMEPEDKIER